MAKLLLKTAMADAVMVNSRRQFSALKSLKGVGVERGGLIPRLAVPLS